MKKIVISVLTLSASLIYAVPRAKQEEIMNKRLKNEQIVVAFDLHEVVFKFSFTKLCKAVYNFFIKNPYSLTLCNPFAGYRLYTTFATTSKTAENVYDKFAQQHYTWLTNSKADFIRVCNSYVLDDKMHLLLKELKQKGYRLAICSNIGQQAFEDFRTEYSEVLDMFEIIVTSHPDRNYLRKPAPEFFEHLKKEVKNVVQAPDTHIIFIDDKKKNAYAAQACGLQSIVFKRPHQLRESLEKQAIVSRCPE